MTRLELTWRVLWVGVVLGCSADANPGVEPAAPGPSAGATGGGGTVSMDAAGSGAAASGNASGSSTGFSGSGAGGSDPGDVNATGNGADAGSTPVTTGMPEPAEGEACLGTLVDTARHSASCGACEQACAPITLAEGLDWPTDIALDATHAYWANASTTQVAFATPGRAAVLAAPLAGGSAAPLAPDQPEPGGIAANGRTVCWTNNGSGQGTGSVVCLGACVDGSCL